MERLLPQDVDKIRIGLINNAYDRGLRASTLGPEPTQWMLLGLQIRERGELITPEVLKYIDSSQTTRLPGAGA